MNSWDSSMSIAVNPDSAGGEIASIAVTTETPAQPTAHLVRFGRGSLHGVRFAEIPDEQTHCQDDVCGAPIEP